MRFKDLIGYTGSKENIMLKYAIGTIISGTVMLLGGILPIAIDGINENSITLSVILIVCGGIPFRGFCRGLIIRLISNHRK